LFGLGGVVFVLGPGFACIYVGFALGVKVLPLFFELIG
jgi:hypothetical protein